MIRPGTSLNKTTGASKLGVVNKAAAAQPKAKLPEFSEFLQKADWVGALAVLDLQKSNGRPETTLWIAYCNFHHGEYRKAMNIYDELLRKPKADKALHLYKALCLYGLCHYEEAQKEALKAPESSLQTRLLYLLAQRLGDDTALMALHHKLGDDMPSQLCKAAVHYFLGHYDDCIDIYKKLLLENKKNLAINIYLAICYYRQEYYEIALDIVQQYLAVHPDSVFATNLKSCCLYETADGKEAHDELKKLEKRFEGGVLGEHNDLVNHNTSVFKLGENALKVFPPLIELYPEAKMNLVIHYLRSGEVENAFRLCHDMEPISQKQYVLKAVVLTLYGQLKKSPEITKQAQEYYKLIGTSATECDTVIGRQCVASCMFLQKQFEDVLLYLNTIKDFMAADDDFNYNFGVASAALGKFKEAELYLTKVQSEKYLSEYLYIAWLAKAYIVNGKVDLAWSLYLEMDTSNETLTLLKLIGNECYQYGHYYYSLKAFDILERLDNEEHTAAKLGAATGVFKDYLTSKESHEHLEETIQILKSSAKHPSIDNVLRVIENFMSESQIE